MYLPTTLKIVQLPVGRLKEPSAEAGADQGANRSKGTQKQEPSPKLINTVKLKKKRPCEVQRVVGTRPLFLARLLRSRTLAPRGARVRLRPITGPVVGRSHLRSKYSLRSNTCGDKTEQVIDTLNFNLWLQPDPVVFSHLWF